MFLFAGTIGDGAMFSLVAFMIYPTAPTVSIGIIIVAAVAVPVNYFLFGRVYRFHRGRLQLNATGIHPMTVRSSVASALLKVAGERKKSENVKALLFPPLLFADLYTFDSDGFQVGVAAQVYGDHKWARILIGPITATNRAMADRLKVEFRDALRGVISPPPPVARSTSA